MSYGRIELYDSRWIGIGRKTRSFDMLQMKRTRLMRCVLTRGGTCFEQEFHHFNMTLRCCCHQWCPSFICSCRDIASMVYQQFDHINVPSICGCSQWRPSAVAPLEWIGPPFYQKFHHFGMTLPRCAI